MQKCIIYHTGVYKSSSGVIKDNLVYFQGDDDILYFPEEMFMAREECEGGLIQFEVEGKWGFADIYTGEIIIEPVWDYAGPFYRGYAHVALGVQHGYIDIDGNIIIPLEYNRGEDIPYRKYFKVTKNKKWGLIDNQNKTIIPFKWESLETSYNHDLIFCSIRKACELDEGTILNTQSKCTYDYTLKWGVYDQNFNLIVQPGLDEKPIRLKGKYDYTSSYYFEKYFILKIKKKYGVLCNDGRWIANIELSKEQAIAMINTILRRFSRDLYI